LGDSLDQPGEPHDDYQKARIAIKSTDRQQGLEGGAQS
jgi:hypothetical protein